MSEDESECEDRNPLVSKKGMEEAFSPPVKDARKEEEEGDFSFYSTKKMKQRLYAQTFECMIASCVILVFCCCCVLAYMFCQPCLLGILVFSACLCPWIPYMNVPLWVSIIMLVSLGWHFTAGRMTLTWQ
jgi:hypothetical protein